MQLGRLGRNHGPMMDFGLGEAANAIRETTGRFAADEIAPPHPGRKSSARTNSHADVRLTHSRILALLAIVDADLLDGGTSADI